MRQNIIASSTASTPQETPAHPLVTYRTGLAKIDFMTGDTARTIRFLKDLASELRDSGFPDTAVHVVKQSKGGGSVDRTEFQLIASSGKTISIRQDVSEKDTDDDCLFVEDEKTNSLWPLHIYGHRLGLLGAGALCAVNPPLAAAAAGALLAIPLSRVAFGSSRVAALKDFVDSTFAVRVPFCKTRHAILKAIAVHLIEAANKGPSLNPIVLEPARRTWALREIVCLLKTSGVEVQVRVPHSSPTPQAPEPKSLDEVVQALDDVENRLKQRNTDKLGARFTAAADAIAQSAKSVDDPALKQVALAFLETLTSGQSALLQAGDRPVRRAEKVAQTLESYVNPDTPAAVRQSLCSEFASALQTATEKAQEEIREQLANGRSLLQEAIQRLRNDHI